MEERKRREAEEKRKQKEEEEREMRKIEEDRKKIQEELEAERRKEEEKAKEVTFLHYFSVTVITYNELFSSDALCVVSENYLYKSTFIGYCILLWEMHDLLD